MSPCVRVPGRAIRAAVGGWIVRVSPCPYCGQVHDHGAGVGPAPSLPGPSFAPRCEPQDGTGRRYRVDVVLEEDLP